jgi:biopolymer transport protein ExbD
MQLPATTTQQDIKDRNVTISIDARQELFVDGERVDLREVGRTARTRLAGRPEGFVLVKSDQGVPYRRVVDVLDELLQVGITNIALPTDKEK